jgi:hypothetical protein
MRCKLGTLDQDLRAGMIRPDFLKRRREQFGYVGFEIKND